jgi:hypothetical protein
MNRVDSKQKLMNAAEVMAQAAANDTSAPEPLELRLLMSGVDAGTEGANVVQAGNTVFVAHPMLDGDTTQMLGTIYNVDTANNYPKNVVYYFDYLQKSGVTHYRVVFDDMLTLNTMKMLQKAMKPKGFEVGILKSKKPPVYLAMVRIKRKS